MIAKIRTAVALHNMLSPGDSVAVGLSGGADSVSLLHALLELREELCLREIRAVHINHGIRGENAARDEQFCRGLCHRLGVPLDCCHEDVPALAAQLGIGLEECGRQCRYHHFSRIAADHGCVIATAHTLSDSVETVIFNLARGSALSGVCGIPPVRTVEGGAKIIRPLIEATREDIESYCATRGLDFVTDETNADTVYSRNHIRHGVIPALLRINPSLHAAVARFSRCAAQDDDFLNTLAADSLEKAVLDNGWDSQALAALPDPLLRRCIVAIARTRGCTPDSAQTGLCVSALRNGSGAVMLTGGTRFAVRDGIARLDSGTDPLPDEPWETPAQFPRTLLPDGRVLFFTEIDLEGTFATQKHQKLLFKNALSCGIIKDNVSELSVRNRREGDRFAPAGRGVNKKLKKFLIEEKVPVRQRSGLAMIAGSDGIIWLEGFGASELCRPAPDDIRVIMPEISGKEK